MERSDAIQDHGFDFELSKLEWMKRLAEPSRDALAKVAPGFATHHDVVAMEEEARRFFSRGDVAAALQSLDEAQAVADRGECSGTPETYVQRHIAMLEQQTRIVLHLFRWRNPTEPAPRNG